MSLVLNLKCSVQFSHQSFIVSNQCFITQRWMKLHLPSLGRDATYWSRQPQRLPAALSALRLFIAVSICAEYPVVDLASFWQVKVQRSNLRSRWHVRFPRIQTRFTSPSQITEPAVAVISVGLPGKIRHRGIKWCMPSLLWMGYKQHVGGCTLRLVQSCFPSGLTTLTGFWWVQVLLSSSLFWLEAVSY